MQAAEVLALAASRGLLSARCNARIDGDVIVVPIELHDPSFMSLLMLLLGELGANVLEASWGHGDLGDVFAHLWEPSTGDHAPPAVTIEHRVLARRRRRR